MIDSYCVSVSTYNNLKYKSGPGTLYKKPSRLTSMDSIVMPNTNEITELRNYYINRLIILNSGFNKVFLIDDNSRYIIPKKLILNHNYLGNSLGFNELLNFFIQLWSPAYRSY